MTAHRDHFHRIATEATDPQARDAATAALLIGDLRYPACRDGSVLELRGDIAVNLARHLTDCGWVWHPERSRIKPRPCAGPGTYDDAVEWVPVDAPDDPLENLAGMSVADLAALPAHVRAEAARRLGVRTETPDPPPGWVQPNLVTITDLPDTDDGPTWRHR